MGCQGFTFRRRVCQGQEDGADNGADIYPYEEEIKGDDQNDGYEREIISEDADGKAGEGEPQEDN